MSNINEYKVVTLGEGRVGKTSLSLKFVNNVFHDNEESTVNANFLEKRLRVNDQDIKLNLWDTAGQERFRAMGPIYYREAKGAVLVYDITIAESFDRVLAWVKELNQQVGKIAIVIAGNKCDREHFRQVDKQKAMEYAQSVGAQHFHVSAKTGKNVDEMYNSLARQIIAADGDGMQRRRRQTRIRIENQALENPQAPAKKKKCC